MQCELVSIDVICMMRSSVSAKEGMTKIIVRWMNKDQHRMMSGDPVNGDSTHQERIHPYAVSQKSTVVFVMMLLFRELLSLITIHRDKKLELTVMRVKV